MGRYAYAWDAKDARGYASWFTEDGLLEVYTREPDEPAIREQGRAAIEHWAAGIRRGALPGLRAPDLAERTRHAPGSTIFDEIEVDSARTRTMLCETRVAGGGTRRLRKSPASTATNGGGRRTAGGSRGVRCAWTGAGRRAASPAR